METFSVVSCASVSTDKQGLKIPGVAPLNFNGSTSHCVWACPTVREKVSLKFVDLHLPSRCKFVFKTTGKYFAPSFGSEFECIPADADATVQYSMYPYRSAFPPCHRVSVPRSTGSVAN